ncbi:hypothetical protein BC835DRAFT_560735 [Cytidiella melzeri]|nr:hypothetical protein BC835DRAFT_560735 [Cytidiella melzeri]
MYEVPSVTYQYGVCYHASPYTCRYTLSFVCRTRGTCIRTYPAVFHAVKRFRTSKVLNIKAKRARDQVYCTGGRRQKMSRRIPMSFSNSTRNWVLVYALSLIGRDLTSPHWSPRVELAPFPLDLKMREDYIIKSYSDRGQIGKTHVGHPVFAFHNADPQFGNNTVCCKGLNPVNQVQA